MPDYIFDIKYDLHLNLQSASFDTCVDNVQSLLEKLEELQLTLLEKTVDSVEATICACLLSHLYSEAMVVESFLMDAGYAALMEIAEEEIGEVRNEVMIALNDLAGRIGEVEVSQGRRLIEFEIPSKYLYNISVRLPKRLDERSRKLMIESLNHLVETLSTLTLPTADLRKIRKILLEGMTGAVDNLKSNTIISIKSRHEVYRLLTELRSFSEIEVGSKDNRSIKLIDLVII